MIALGWTSKHTTASNINSVMYNPYKPSFICFGMARELSCYFQEVSFFFLCNSHGTYSGVKIALPPVLSTTESKDRENLSQAGTNTC